MQGGLLAIDHVADFGLFVFDIPIEVDDAGSGGHEVTHFGGELEAGFVARAVDLGDEALQDGRAGRHLSDDDVGAVFLGDGGEGGPDALGDGVALVGAFGFAHEVDLDIGDSGAAPHEVVAHEAVEIKR